MADQGPDWQSARRFEARRSAGRRRHLLSRQRGGAGARGPWWGKKCSARIGASLSELGGDALGRIGRHRAYRAPYGAGAIWVPLKRQKNWLTDTGPHRGAIAPSFGPLADLKLHHVPMANVWEWHQFQGIPSIFKLEIANVRQNWVLGTTTQKLQ